MEIFHSLPKEKLFHATGDQEAMAAWAGIEELPRARLAQTILISSTWPEIPA